MLPRMSLRAGCRLISLPAKKELDQIAVEKEDMEKF